MTVHLYSSGWAALLRGEISLVGAVVYPIYAEVSTWSTDTVITDLAPDTYGPALSLLGVTIDADTAEVRVSEVSPVSSLPPDGSQVRGLVLCAGIRLVAAFLGNSYYWDVAGKARRQLESLGGLVLQLVPDDDTGGFRPIIGRVLRGELDLASLSLYVRLLADSYVHDVTRYLVADVAAGDFLGAPVATTSLEILDEGVLRTADALCGPVTGTTRRALLYGDTGTETVCLRVGDFAAPVVADNVEVTVRASSGWIAPGDGWNQQPQPPQSIHDYYGADVVAYYDFQQENCRFNTEGSLTIVLPSVWQGTDGGDGGMRLSNTGASPAFHLAGGPRGRSYTGWDDVVMMTGTLGAEVDPVKMMVISVCRLYPQSANSSRFFTLQGSSGSQIIGMISNTPAETLSAYLGGQIGSQIAVRGPFEPQWGIVVTGALYDGVTPTLVVRHNGDEQEQVTGATGSTFAGSMRIRLGWFSNGGAYQDIAATWVIRNHDRMDSDAIRATRGWVHDTFGVRL